MSTTSSSATTTLYVNGKPAQDELARLRADLDKYKKQLLDIASDPSKGLGSKEWDEARKKLKATETELNRVSNNVSNVTRALSRLDKATPGELRKYLRQLKQELAGIERGSKAWDEHMKKIRAVQTELNKLNAEMKGHESLWSRFANKMFAWGAAIQAVMAGMTGLKQSMRSAVEAYAEMDQEMANVRKFTGMTAAQVEDLNEEFKRIDTRSSREQLNQLAQEAGRLGKSSKEDVLGFVRAADQINVALDDLGEGATLTLSKIAGAFGEEDKYGTEQALLKVGSVINELSQNCRASAPYLADFTQRLTGAGTTAKMTIPQLMAFGAVLDSNGAQLESSATALGQIIIKLYRDPAKYAEAAGMDVKKFTDLLKTDANEAVLMFLETLNKAGNLDVLAPMLADMGEKGSRSVQTLTMLAGKIDEVRAQQAAANQAFVEGSSVTKEFNVQNNTVQAGLEKAKKRFNEMAVELGQKLAPAMKYAITSSAAMMKALSATVSFVSEHKKAIANLAVVITALTIATKASAIATAYHTAMTKLAAAGTALWNGVLVVGTTIQKTYTYVLGLAKVAQIAFTEGLTAARIAFAALNTVMKMNPFGLILTAVTAVTLAIINLTGKTDEYTKSVGEAINTARGYDKELIKEQHDLDVLFGKLDAAKKGTKEYESAKNQIIKQYGQYLNGLINEKGEIISLTDAYVRLAAAVRRAAQERGIAAAREKLDSDYYQDLATNLQKLQASLEEYGYSARDAAALVQKFNTYAVTGKSNFTQADQDALNKTLPFWRWNVSSSPVGIGNTILNHYKTYKKASAQIDSMETAVKPYSRVNAASLDMSIKGLQQIVASGRGGTAIVFTQGSDGSNPTTKKVSHSEAVQLLQDYQLEQSFRTGVNTQTATTTATTPTTHYPTGGGGGRTGRGGNSTKQEDKFKSEKEWRAMEEALNRIGYLTGERNYEEYTTRMDEIAIQFYEKQLSHTDLTLAERLSIEAQYYDAAIKQQESANTLTVDAENRSYAERLAELKQSYIDNKITRDEYNQQAELAELEHLRKLDQIQSQAAQGSNDPKVLQRAQQAHDAYQQKLFANQEKMRKAAEQREKEHLKRLGDAWQQYFVTDEEKKQEQYKLGLRMLDEVYNAEVAAAAGNAAAKLEIDKRYAKARKKLYDEIFKSDKAGQKSWNEWIGEALDKVFGDGTWEKYGETVKQAFASMTSMMEGFNQLAQAEADAKISRLEKQYDREISMAEGNNRKVKALERKKEKETARIKAEAQRKEFAQQVMNAISSTALAAINAYASASKIAWWLGPVAAGLALAAGAVQIAAIKKQQEASEAKGFSEGGFTPKGPKDKPVGVVHAGEWVASQRLLANPVARPMIEALDYAQRNNTLGSLRPADVSRSVTAPAVIAGAATDGQNERLMVAVAAALGNYDGTMARLTDRLNEPFVTINTVTGDMGIKEAQDEYQRLMNNTLPKSKRK